jgi:hypothetical protein
MRSPLTAVASIGPSRATIVRRELGWAGLSFTRGGLMRKLTTSLAALVVALFTFVVPAGAITNGQADAGEHPYVGELIFFDADAMTLASTTRVAGSVAR